MCWDSNLWLRCPMFLLNSQLLKVTFLQINQMWCHNLIHLESLDLPEEILEEEQLPVTPGHLLSSFRQFEIAPWSRCTFYREQRTGLEHRCDRWLSGNFFSSSNSRAVKTGDEPASLKCLLETGCFLKLV